MNDESGHVDITTRLEFHDALRAAFKEFSHKGCREVFLCDEDFADWPLSDAPVLEALTSWVLPHRKLFMVARHFDEMPRKHARFVEWRRTYAHVMECKALEDDENAELPCMLLAPPVVCVRLFDPLRYRGGLTHENGDMIRNRELFDAVSQRSVESFPASVLGL
ncbi:hypothetical protein [Piscinibacter terrae]|uniref:Uncharacterized protein n=1 Tax=Piscinibacter terrae TaxID=2496871 RepID=A0A3N7JYG2_9BURK|nr:hypothetical protein [Albitalea terrae]RQP23895.1 hypothetical protein DZC73_17445 [Albitalea terrae]